MKDHLVLKMDYGGKAVNVGEVYQEHTEVCGSPCFQFYSSPSERGSEHQDPRLKGD